MGSPKRSRRRKGIPQEPDRSESTARIIHVRAFSARARSARARSAALG
jgi:hypothetical protein